MIDAEPLGARVLVQILDEQASQIWIPNEVQRPRRGVVIAAGDGCDYLEKGDEVVFDPSVRGIVQFQIERERAYVMPESYVLVRLARAFDAATP